MSNINLSLENEDRIREAGAQLQMAVSQFYHQAMFWVHRAIEAGQIPDGAEIGADIILRGEDIVFRTGISLHGVSHDISNKN